MACLGKSADRVLKLETGRRYKQASPITKLTLRRFMELSPSGLESDITALGAGPKIRIQ